jgi:hypothetical protein
MDNDSKMELEAVARMIASDRLEHTWVSPDGHSGYAGEDGRYTVEITVSRRQPQIEADGLYRVR